MRYFDAHCHIQFDQYDSDREAIAEAMAEKEIGGLVVGCDAASSRSAVAFVENREGFYAAVGQHPNDNHAEVFDEQRYRELLLHPKVVAVGECGLDYFRPTDTSEDVKQKQKDLFQKHIRLAGETHKPLVVHARPSKGTVDAYNDALDLLEIAKKEFGDALTGDLHFFVGDSAVADRAVAIGFTVSYTAVITFARDYDDVIRSLSLENILSETDAPYVAPARRRGERNDPLSVVDVVQQLAMIRGEDEEVVRSAMLVNAQKLFKLGGL